MRASDVQDQSAKEPSRPLVTRERLAGLTAIVERRIAERAIAPATLDALGRLRGLLRERAQR